MIPLSSAFSCKTTRFQTFNRYLCLFSMITLGDIFSLTSEGVGQINGYRKWVSLKNIALHRADFVS